MTREEWLEMRKIGSEDGWYQPNFVNGRDAAFVVGMSKMLQKERRECLALAQNVKYGTKVGEYPDFMDIPGEEFFESIACIKGELP